MKKKEIKETLIFLVDGFTGILAFMIYNLIIYLAGVNFGIFRRLWYDTGYFYLNTLNHLNLTISGKIILVTIAFIVSFLIGVKTGHLVRRYRKDKYRY